MTNSGTSPPLYSLPGNSFAYINMNRGSDSPIGGQAKILADIDTMLAADTPPATTPTAVTGHY